MISHENCVIQFGFKFEINESEAVQSNEKLKIILKRSIVSYSCVILNTRVIRKLNYQKW